MALTSVYYDGPVTESQRAQNRTGAAQYGVYGPEDFKVTPHPSIANAVIVKAGRAHGYGVTDTADIDQIVNCTPLSVGQSRWDIIVVRRNWQPALGGPSTLVAMHAGGLPVIPAQRKVGPGVEDDQPLAFIKWQGGTSAPVEFIDLRVHAANGGLHAVSDLVRTYLTGVGTEVNINGTVWALQMGANSLPAWSQVSQSGAIPLFGFGGALAGSTGTDPAFLVQAGSTLLDTDLSGFARLTFPKPFPNGLLTVLPSSGDMNLDRTIQAALSFGVAGGLPHGTGTKNDVVISVERYNGAPQTSSRVRCNWIAIGW